MPYIIVEQRITMAYDLAVLILDGLAVFKHKATQYLLAEQ